MTWGWQLKHGKDKPYPGVKPYENEDLLVADVKKSVDEGKARAGHLPRVLVIGALGRCGRGAVDLCVKAGLQDIIVSFRDDHKIYSLAHSYPTEMGSARDLRQARTIQGDY